MGTVQDTGDKDRGLQALQFYHNEMLYRYPSQYKLKFDTLQTTLQARPGGKGFLAGLGFGIQAAEMSMGRVGEAMKQLAKQGGGAIPKSNGMFVQALTDEASQFNLEMFGDASIETVKQLAIGVTKVGDKVIEGGEGILGSLKYAVPLIILVGGIVVFAYSKFKPI